MACSVFLFIETRIGCYRFAIMEGANPSHVRQLALANIAALVDYDKNTRLWNKAPAPLVQPPATTTTTTTTTLSYQAKGVHSLSTHA